MPAKTPAPVTLTGRHVQLVPLTMEHLPDLFAAGGGDDEVWAWQGGPTPHSQEELGAKLSSLLEASARGKYFPFAVIHRASGRAVGWTTFMDVAPDDERLEIGWTWYGRRTGARR